MKLKIYAIFAVVFLMSTTLLTSCVGCSTESGLPPLSKDYAPSSIVGMSFILDQTMQVTFKENNICSVIVPGVNPLDGTVYITGKPEYRYQYIDKNKAVIVIAYKSRLEYNYSEYSKLDYIYTLTLDFYEESSGYASGKYDLTVENKYNGMIGTRKEDKSNNVVEDRVFVLR